MVNGWKIIAIVFTILFVLETSFLMWGMSLVNEDIERKNECIFNVCDGFDWYDYDEDSSLCECYNEDLEVIKQEYIR